MYTQKGGKLRGVDLSDQEPDKHTCCFCLSGVVCQCWCWVDLCLFIFGWVRSYCCVHIFSSCDKGELLFVVTWASFCSGFCYSKAWALGTRAQLLWPLGSVAPQHVGSSQTKDQTRVPCTGRQILNHWATKEVANGTLFGKSVSEWDL